MIVQQENSIPKYFLERCLKSKMFSFIVTKKNLTQKHVPHSNCIYASQKTIQGHAFIIK